MYCYQHFTDRKDEEIDFDECYSLVRFRSKRTEEGKKCFHNKYLLVPEMTDKEKKRAPLQRRHLPSPRRNGAGWSRKGRTGRDSPRRFYGKDP